MSISLTSRARGFKKSLNVRTIREMSFGAIFVTHISEFVFDRDKENNDQSDLKQSVTLKMRLTTILTGRLTCTNNSFSAKFGILKW